MRLARSVHSLLVMYIYSQLYTPLHIHEVKATPMTSSDCFAAEGRT